MKPVLNALLALLTIVSAGLFAAVIWLVLIVFVSPLMAQEHSHDDTVGHFYERWMMPGPRTVSCCNKKDCAVVEHVRYWNGQLQMQRMRDNQWLNIPREKLESNFDDAYDSPDGFSHMCSNGDNVYCAVLGSGI